MTKIDIVSGFLGAGKTTLIRKLLGEALGDTKVVLIENEFGEIGIDGGFLKESGIEIKEMNSGCICCSLVGDFGTSLKEVLQTYEPERILIEPSGVGKLSDVMKAVQDVIDTTKVVLNSAVAVVDASRCRMYIKNFGEFFINQIAHAGTIVLSRTGKIPEEKLAQAIALIREHNPRAVIVTTPWEELDGKDILDTIEGAGDLEAEMMAELLADRDKEQHHHHEGEACGCGHDHHHHQGEECHHGHHHEDGECCHGHHHHEGEECHHDHHHEGEECCHGHHHEGEECHHGHHHHEGEECHHEHHHGEECGCGHHHGGEHHHDHHADEVFTSWGMETPAAYGRDAVEHILEELENEGKYGFILRAKGMVPGKDGGWVYFDYVPGESNVRAGKPDMTGKFCVIGSRLNEDALKALFESARA